MSAATKHQAAVYWFTGLPASGKSTLAGAFADRLRRDGAPVHLLDGDAVRAVMPGIGFSREEREQYLRHMGYLASVLEQNGVTVVCSFVSPYAASRDFARSLCKRFCEIYVSTPLAACEARDPKGLYRRARAGEIRQMTGVDDPYEAPASPELTLDTSRRNLEECAAELKNFSARIQGV